MSDADLDTLTHPDVRAIIDHILIASSWEAVGPILADKLDDLGFSDQTETASMRLAGDNLVRDAFAAQLTHERAGNVDEWVRATRKAGALSGWLYRIKAWPVSDRFEDELYRVSQELSDHLGADVTENNSIGMPRVRVCRVPVVIRDCTDMNAIPLLFMLCDRLHLPRFRKVTAPC